MDEQDTRQRRFRKLMESFLAERMELKLKPILASETKAEGDNIEKILVKKQEVLETYKLCNWLEDAARRVGQLTMVTHTLKAVNPNAKGTNLYCPAEELPALQEVGSHVLAGGNVTPDIVGHAGALDVYAFLRLEFEGRSLLGWLDANDPDLLAAMGGDENAKEWTVAFTGIRNIKEQLASHKLGKQIYWLVGDDPCDDEQYHLLSPLYASSLAHAVHTCLREDWFGEAAILARESRRKEQYSDHVLHEYFDLAVQKLGGTKPQNVSQLNSERRGRNYLLDSRPPRWTLQELRPPKGPTSIFSRFGKQKECATLVAKLRMFLESDPPSNAHTRHKRDGFIDSIVGEFILYIDRLLKLKPGWTAAPECLLPPVEKLLVDPGRAAIDPEFDAERKNSGWHDDIAKRFGLWLNSQLNENLPMGDVETIFWSDEFDETIGFTRRPLVFELKETGDERHG